MNGERVYASTCRFCHGPTGQGGNSGSAFPDTLTVGAIQTKLVTGGPQMPPFEAVLSEVERRDVAVYVAEVLLAAR
jgi:mono/diheme cytochrome c family protein